MNKDGYNWEVLVILIILVSAIFGLLYYLVSGLIKESYHQYVSKIELKTDISKVVKNGGNLSIVTYTYNNRGVNTNTRLQHYPQQLFYDNENLTLSTVLEDLLSDYYRDSLPNRPDSLYCNQLKVIKDEFSRNNPFEELQPDQRINFQNVQSKIPEQYDLIKEDMLRISNMLKEKNALTEHYLQKSNLSFWISIGAVIVTLIFGVVQVLQNSSKAKRDAVVHNDILQKLGEKKE